MKRRSKNAEIRVSFGDNLTVKNKTVGEGKENMQPFLGESDDDEDEVFFGGVVTNKERSKMAKLHRRTQVFISNFRNLSSCSGMESSDESSSLAYRSHESSMSLSCSSKEPESPDSCQTSDETATYQHLELSHIERIAPSSTDSPSVLAHRAAAKIQTWFRLTRQAQEYRGAMEQVQLLEAKTDVFIQELRREKERRQCGTPDQGGRLDTALTSPMVIVPSHRLHLVESSPQQAYGITTLQECPSPAYHELTLDSTKPTHVVFNATNDGSSIGATKVTSEGTTSSPVRSDELITEAGFARQSVSLQANSESTSSAADLLESRGTPDPHMQVTNQNKAYASIESVPCNTPSFCQSDPASQVTSASSASTVYRGASSEVVLAVKVQEISREHFVGTPSNFSEQNATDSPFLQGGKLTASYPQHDPLRELEMSGTLSSFPKITYKQIQSPTVFSTPRLFPMTIQAVQSQQSIPSAVLFSPLKISDRKPVKDRHHSETVSSQGFDPQVTVSQRPQREIEKENHNSAFDIDTCQPAAPNAASVRQDLDYAHPRMNRFTASSTPLANLPLSPNVSVRRSAKKVAIVNPNSPHFSDSTRSIDKLHCNTDGSEYETMPGADEGFRRQFTTTQEQGRSRHLFPSPLVMTRDTHETQIFTTDATGRPDLSSSNASRLQAAYGGQPDVRTSPLITGARSSESARRKLETLEQKKAELARLRAEKAELKQTLKTENETCLAMKQEVQSALRSNTSQTNIPTHLLSLGCQGISSLTLTDQELDIVTRLHTIRNSHQDNQLGGAASPMVAPAPRKGSLHLKWHLALVTEVQRLSSPGRPVCVARPILANQDFGKARRIRVTRTSSPAQRVPRQDRSRCPSGYAHTPREKLAF